jgi:hypothetical protein
LRLHSPFNEFEKRGLNPLLIGDTTKRGVVKWDNEQNNSFV